MTNKKDIVDVNQEEIIEEVHERIDALITVLEKKGICTSEEIESELEKIYEKKNTI
jgi:hypothetical protein